MVRGCSVFLFDRHALFEDKKKCPTRLTRVYGYRIAGPGPVVNGIRARRVVVYLSLFRCSFRTVIGGSRTRTNDIINNAAVRQRATADE